MMMFSRFILKATIKNFTNNSSNWMVKKRKIINLLTVVNFKRKLLKQQFIFSLVK